MKLIGLSGGPGSGKSAAAEIFAGFGVCRVVDADRVCAAIYSERENTALSAIRGRWGKRVFRADGFADKTAIAEIVFRDKTERGWLGSLLHPEIFRRIDEELRHCNMLFAMIEAALLFEAGWNAEMFRSVCVWADPEIRMKRLLARGWTPGEARRRIEAQMPDAEKLELADFAAVNNSTFENLRLQCAKINDALVSEISG